jgi:shikimate 5-dehydrogenase
MPAVAEELLRLSTNPTTLRGGVGIVIGTGGAARAAIVALASHLGLGRVLVRGRSMGEPGHAVAYIRQIDQILAAAGGPGVAVALGAEGLHAPDEEDARLVAIVQATSCGMKGAAPGDVVADAVRWEQVPASAVALDVVYAPQRTPFLDRARARGLACDNGLGMLARQGALAFELWLGVPPPIAIMRAAIDDSIS